MFKIGDYIVIESINPAPRFETAYRTGHIYRQREGANHLSSEIDSFGATHNAWGLVNYHKQAIGKSSANWRYATQEEINEYKRIGKPYDVTTLSKQELILDKFKVGDIVVSLDNRSPSRAKGEMFTVLPDSYGQVLYYKESRCSSDEISWRSATPEETHLFFSGGRNISELRKKEVSTTIENVGPTDFLEEWLRKTEEMNLSINQLRYRIGDVYYCPKRVHDLLEGVGTTRKAEILHNKFELNKRKKWGSEIEYPLPESITSKGISVKDLINPYKEVTTLSKPKELEHQKPVLISKTQKVSLVVVNTNN